MPYYQSKSKYFLFGLISISCAAIALIIFVIKSSLADVWNVRCSGCSLVTHFSVQRTLPQNYFVTSVVWSPDGKYLSVGSLFEENINVYDTSDWKIISNIQRDRPAGEDVSLIQFTNDSKNIILPRIKGGNIASIPPNNRNISVQKWNISSHSISQSYFAVFENEWSQPDDVEVKDSEAKATAINADDTLIAASVGGSQNGHVLVYNAFNAQILRNILCERYNIPLALAFSRDKRDLAIGGCTPNNVSIFDLQSGKLLSQTRADGLSAFFMSYNQIGSLIAVGFSSTEHGMVTILDSSNGKIISFIPRAHATITNLQWIGNDCVFASYDAWHPDGSVGKIWDVKSLKVLAEFGGRHVELMSINPDGSLLASVIGGRVIITKIH